MSPWIDYLLKLSVSLSAVALFYHFILRPHTFYNWNRWYLLIYSIMSFFLPCIDISTTIQKQEIATNQLVSSIPVVNASGLKNIIPAKLHDAENRFSVTDLVLLTVLAGVVIMMIRLILQFAAYLKIKKQAELLSSEEGVNIYKIQNDAMPFSFGNSVFVNPDLHKEEDLRKIILHEYIHVKQKHSIDNVWCEILCALNWYNPFAWLIRYAIRQNLEYIADRSVIENGVNPKQYQYLLLKVIGVPEFRIANQFSFSSLKQRIIMMNKAKTARVHLIRFLFVIPVLVFVVFTFRKNIASMEAVKQLTKITFSLFPYNQIEENSKIAGLILDGATGEAIANYPIDLYIQIPGLEDLREKYVTTLKTDKDGFYFYEDSLSGKSKEYYMYSLSSKDEIFKQFSHGSTNISFEQKFLNYFYAVTFTGKRGTNVKVKSYNLKVPDLQKDAKSSEVRNEIIAQLADIKHDYNLGAGFRNKYPYLVPEKMITKFGDAYFDQKKEMIGYVSQMEFYLDGKEVDFEKINEVFSKIPVEVKNMQTEGESKYHSPFSAKKIRLYYFTFPYSMAPPPKPLLSNNNVEWKRIKDLDLTKLENEAYFLDGFRQANGMGSNLKPDKQDVRRVALFKGDLAKYYDKQADQVWWIETRPAEQVFERPLF